MSDNDQKNLVIKLELPETVNRALLPLADSIGQTLSTLWTGTFSFISTWSEKKQIDQQYNLEAYRELTQSKLNKIDKENLCSPKISVVGPAIESSKYYFEENYYREMFSNLISKSADKTFNGLIHPSYTEVIKQLNSNDANLLEHIKNSNMQIPIVYFNYQISGYKPIPGYKNVTTFGKTNESYEESLVSIDNLIRLGLIEIEYSNPVSDPKEYYDEILSINWITPNSITPIGEGIESILRDNPVRITHTRGVLIATNYGSNFIKICL